MWLCVRKTNLDGWWSILLRWIKRKRPTFWPKFQALIRPIWALHLNFISYLAASSVTVWTCLTIMHQDSKWLTDDLAILNNYLCKNYSYFCLTQIGTLWIVLTQYRSCLRKLFFLRRLMTLTEITQAYCVSGISSCQLFSKYSWVCLNSGKNHITIL